MTSVCLMSDIKAVVARHYGLSVADLEGPDRVRRVAWARQMVMALAHRHTRMSLAEIGRRLGGRDHTTVMHGIQAIADRCRNNPETEADMRLILAQLRGMSRILPLATGMGTIPAADMRRRRQDRGGIHARRD